MNVEAGAIDAVNETGAGPPRRGTGHGRGHRRAPGHGRSHRRGPGHGGRGQRRGPRSPVSPAGAERGFTVVEVLVAVVILSLGLVTLMGFATYTVQEFNRSKTVAMATTAAREQLDSLRHVEYDDLQLGDATFVHSTGNMQLWITRVVEKPKANLKKITVSVVDGQAKEYQRYITYTYNENPE